MLESKFIEIKDGIAYVKNTEIPVFKVLVRLAHGHSENEIFLQFPELNKEHLAACREYGKDVLKMNS